MLVAGIITSWTFFRRAQDEAKAKDKQRIMAEANAAEARKQEKEAKQQRMRAEEKEAEAKREKATAQGERAAAEAHLARFNRLKVVVKLEDAEKEAGDLFPAWPRKIGGLDKWIEERGEPLEDELPKIRTTLVELEARSLPQTEEEKRKDREGHPRSGEYQAQKTMVGSLQLAMGVREGKKKPADPKVPEDLTDNPIALRFMAWDLVDPQPECRGPWQGSSWARACAESIGRL